MIDDMYENTPTIAYEKGDEIALFYRVCPICGRFVKADGVTMLNSDEPNATCKRHGRVRMPFCTWMEGEEYDDI